MTVARQVPCPYQLKCEKSNIILPCTRLSVKSNNDYYKPKSRPQAELTCFKSPFDNHCFLTLAILNCTSGRSLWTRNSLRAGGILTMSLTAGLGTEVGTDLVLSVLKKLTFYKKHVKIFLI